MGNKIEFKRNKDGTLEAYKNGKKIGKIVTIGDMVKAPKERKKNG